MKQFKVFKHPAGEIQAVKQGWCWPAFFFNFIWAMVAKMWGLGVGTLVFFIVLGIVLGLSGGEEGGDVLINLISLVASILFGVNGNTWREKNLLSRGFDLKDTVTAANKDGAIALFLKNATA
ncbi:MAG: DUF2628 domain-containing protein [Gammaproteobacteria bacterium]